MWGLSKVPVLGGYAKQADDVLPFGHLGDITKSERYINVEKA
ncbi:MAG: hypothetical protein ACKPKO_31400 [Candidatus Fonsibacter sp.]